MKEKTYSGIMLNTVGGLFWLIVAAFLGFVNQLQLTVLWPTSGSMIGYGYLRPLFTISLLFGAGLSFFLAVAYYALKESGNAPKWNGLASFAFVGQMFAVGYGWATVIVASNKGREFGEMAFLSDVFIGFALLSYLIIAFVSIKGKINIGTSFSIAAAAAGLVAFLVGNFSLPYSFFGSSFITFGVQDAAVQEFYRGSVLGYFILLPFFAALFTFAPSYVKANVFSAPLASLQILATVILAPLAGLAGLAFIPGVDVLSSVGVAAGVAFFVTVLMGYINGRYTLLGAKKDAIVNLFSYGLTILIVVALLRMITSFPMIQESLAFTTSSMQDVSVDAITYLLLVFTAAAYLIARNTEGIEVSEGTMNISLWAAVAGSVLIIVGNLAGGVMQSSAISKTTAEGAFAVTNWSVVLYGSETGRLFTIKGLAFFGYLLLVVSVKMTAISIYSGLLGKSGKA